MGWKNGAGILLAISMAGGAYAQQETMRDLHGDMVVTARHYDGTTLIGEDTLRDAADRGGFRLTMEYKKVDGAMEITATCIRIKGAASETALNVAFDFSDWDPANYVLAPAAVYNGNRYRAIGTGYNPDYPKDMYYNPSVPLTISNNPRLNITKGQPGLIELQTGNLATPALCFFSPRTKKGFIVLTTQGTRAGNNGLTIAENAGQDSCSFQVSAPAMRRLAAGFGDFHPSGDKAPDWVEGDSLKLRFRVYIFDAANIPSLLRKFMRVRKSLTGPNHPRDLLPKSEQFKLGTDIARNSWSENPAGNYYRPENSPDFQLGWVAGMIDTYPLLAMDSPLLRERVGEEIDFVVRKLQGKSGFFYGGITATGKIRPEKMNPAYPAVQAMVRKNGDALFWLIKHFELLRAQGHGAFIKKDWETSARRLAMAFVRAWKRYGQFGQYIVPENGDIAVFNSTAGAKAPAGLVLAYDYFKDPEFLAVAKAAAAYYYERDVVGQGLTGGNSGDISQDADSDSATDLLESLMALYHATDDPVWIKKAEDVAALVSTWTLSYDEVFPPNSDIARLDGHMAGAVFASVQNKHAAPGICTSSGDCLFKLYRATGDTLYAALIRDIEHAAAETVNRPGHLTTHNLVGSSMERIQPSDAEGRGSTGRYLNTRNAWTETDGVLMALELPGVYVQTDTKRMVVFDHLFAKFLSGDTIELDNPTMYDASVSVMVETSRQASVPMGYTGFLKWPCVDVKAGGRAVVCIHANGSLTVLNQKPFVIPGIQEWQGGVGWFRVGARTAVALDAAGADSLKVTAGILQEELEQLTGAEIPVRTGKPRAGDITLSLGAGDAALGVEGYRLEAVGTSLRISANCTRGLFWGTRTLLQVLKQDSLRFPCGSIKDYPKYAIRGFVLDAGRRFFSMDYLKHCVEVMAIYKMNDFHVHLNDNGFHAKGTSWDSTYAAFRLECDTYPALTARDGSYTKAEFKAFESFAHSRGVNVVPEIDVPAHSLAFTKMRPEIGSKLYGMDHLDLDNPVTYRVIDSIFGEYLSGPDPVFSGPDVHIGTDEYNKKAAEQFRAFTDHYIRLVQGYGKNVRLWGSLTHAAGTTPVMSKGVTMNVWYNGYADPREMEKLGYDIISTPDDWVYIVPTAKYYHDFLDTAKLFNEWEPVQVGDIRFPEGDPHIKGGSFAVWNDKIGNGITDREIDDRVLPAMQVLSQKMWRGTDAQMTFAGFTSQTARLDSARTRRNEYHVSVSGSDAGDGSAKRPFRTIMAAANVAMPGDVITVHAGTYREQITPPRGGNSDKERIVYQAAKGERVVIKGSEIVKGWKRTGGDTWVVRLPNTFFGKFNPYSDRIRGDWFTPIPKDRIYHTGAVYLHGDWLMEAAAKEEVMQPEDEKDPLWWASVDSANTTIWAQFREADPNVDTVEINVRQTVFYPDKPFVNFITVKGFVMEDAATNWAPPTAEQMGLIGTHWSRGWIIEDNTIQYSKCSGIALGKYGDKWDNNNTESAEGYVGTIRRALAFGWNRDTIGGDLVQDNVIAFCEQTGIVGSMGCAFSVVKGNVIHDCHIRRLFGGAEMAGIKFHGAIDVRIEHNQVYRSERGIWLDWMAQGAQIMANLFHDNVNEDIFLEVDHGPMLVANNICLSRVSLVMNSSGAAFAHNLFAGGIHVIPYDSRLTPFMKPHSTSIAGLHDNPGGDVRFINNLFVRGGNARAYDKSLQGAMFSGNVYTMGANKPLPGDFYKDAPAGLKEKTETKELYADGFDAGVGLARHKDGEYLVINFDRGWVTEYKRSLVTTSLLGKAVIPGLPFENPDGSPVRIDTDYCGKKRDAANPSPGPFEITGSGRRQIRVW